MTMTGEARASPRGDASEDPKSSRSPGPLTHQTVVFDLDGTLIEAASHDAHDRDDVELLSAGVPIPHVVALFERYLRDGAQVFVATSRPFRIFETTIRALRSAGVAKMGVFDVYHRQDEAFDMAACVRDKVAVIRKHGATLIVGDRDDLEGEAARIAGITFLHVRDVPR